MEEQFSTEDLKEFENTFRHNPAGISASISIFYSVAHPSDFPFGMGGTVQCILMHMLGTRLNDFWHFCPKDLVIIERGVREYKVY